MFRFIIYFFILLSNYSFCQLNDSTKQVNFTKKSTLMSCILPGLGQCNNNKIRPTNIKNRLWWKLPIIYGFIGSTTYLINFNHQEFKKIKNERIHRRDNGNNPLNYPLYSSSDLKIIQDQYSRLRDLSIISFIGAYVLQIIDANVEAHLFLFDISDNLGLQIKPILQTGYPSSYVAPQLSINIKL